MNNWYENWKKERPILGLTAGVGGGGVGNFNQGSGYPVKKHHQMPHLHVQAAR